jgi:hypothetical protein
MMIKRIPVSLYPDEEITYFVADEGPGRLEDRALVCLEGLLFELPEMKRDLVLVLSERRPHVDSFHLRLNRSGMVLVEHRFALVLPPYTLELLGEFPRHEAYFSMEQEDGTILPKDHTNLRPLSRI